MATVCAWLAEAAMPTVATTSAARKNFDIKNSFGFRMGSRNEQPVIDGDRSRSIPAELSAIHPWWETDSKAPTRRNRNLQLEAHLIMIEM
jgi:hypothetical protein